MLDTVVTVETPEGVQLPLKPAGICPRVLAYLIDLLIKTGVYIAVMLVLGWLGSAGMGLAMIIFFLLEWIYPVLFELRSGATPGKRKLALKVIHDDGTPITLAGSMIRNLLRAVDILPFGYTAGFISMAVSTSAKRLGDLAAGTVVVYEHESKSRVLIDAESALPPLPNLSVDEQMALITFAERSQSLTRERSEELASILSPLLQRYDEGPVAVLKKMARGLVG